MSKLDEINERLNQLLPTTYYKITDHKEESFTWAMNYQSDVKYLLSIIEQAEHALWRISTLNIPAPINQFKTESEAFQAFASDALKVIRGN